MVEMFLLSSTPLYERDYDKHFKAVFQAPPDVLTFDQKYLNIHPIDLIKYFLLTLILRQP